MRTIWVFGDQLNRNLGALREADPRGTTVLLVESEALLRSRKHVQRLHFVIAAMRRFAAELEAQGFGVDLRRAATLEDGLRAHVEQHRPAELMATEPNARAARALCVSELAAEVCQTAGHRARRCSTAASPPGPTSKPSRSLGSRLWPLLSKGRGLIAYICIRAKRVLIATRKVPQGRKCRRGGLTSERRTSATVQKPSFSDRH